MGWRVYLVNKARKRNKKYKYWTERDKAVISRWYDYMFFFLGKESTGKPLTLKSGFDKVVGIRSICENNCPFIYQQWTIRTSIKSIKHCWAKLNT